MKMNIISSDPTIIDVEFDEFENLDFTQIFNQPYFNRDYGNLSVDYRRRVIENNHGDQKTFDILQPLMYTILCKIFELELLRYPLDIIKGPDKQNGWGLINHFVRNATGITKVIDQAGFYMPWHIDNRWQIMNGIINVQDNCVSTHFSITDECNYWTGNDYSKDNLKNKEIFHIGNSKKYTGTFWANTEKTWHCVPICEEDRKLLLIGLSITPYFSNSFFSKPS